MICKKRGQIWYSDFIVAVLIFSLALMLYYSHITNSSMQEDAIMEELVADGKSISSALISGGSPTNWTNTTVIRIGITNNDHRINQTKIDEFYAMEYLTAHRLFGTRFNHYIFFENSTGNRINITGGETIGTEPSDHKRLIQITRFMIYESEIIKMKVQIWW
ncbi:MAG: hypothetical protein U9R34_00200 [Nanoarchaeota archaeon]|nr:hypothetical protein [Nanoarchaeota archaeon]